MPSVAGPSLRRPVGVVPSSWNLPASKTKCSFHASTYNRFATVGSTTVPIWQQDHEVKLPECTLDRVREANQPKRNGHCPKFLRFQCSNLYVIKGGHKVGSNLCGFLFGYCIRENSAHRPQRRIPECRHLSLRLDIETVRPTAPEGAARW